MRYALTLVLAGCLLGHSLSVKAQDSVATPTPKRQLADCMLKRMSAERSLTYNDATKLCKEQMKPIKPVTAANTTGKPLS